MTGFRGLRCKYRITGKWILHCSVLLGYRIAENLCVVQNFAVFADRSAFTKIKTTKIAASTICIASCILMRAGAAKIKTAKISLSAALE